jgi:UDP-N-acetylglucosamine/UDP-N-acetylgalactosamine diphosphorylase
MASAIQGAVSNLMARMSIGTAEPSDEELNQLKQSYEQAGQGQVFAFFDELSSSEKAALYHQLANFDPNRINVLADRATKSGHASADPQPGKLEPLPEAATASILDSDPADLERWYKEGLGLIADGKVAVVLMAGGQGTRLGSSAPKGCFDIGLPSGKSLFQIQAERIVRLQVLAARVAGKESTVIPWYVMTSGPTRKPTEEFFEKYNFFGLDKENVIIFEQGVLPCISNDGKILLETKSKVHDRCPDLMRA